jgi:hypothetical protein
MSLERGWGKERVSLMPLYDASDASSVAGHAPQASGTW